MEEQQPMKVTDEQLGIQQGCAAAAQRRICKIVRFCQTIAR